VFGLDPADGVTDEFGHGLELEFDFDVGAMDFHGLGAARLSAAPAARGIRHANPSHAIQFRNVDVTCLVEGSSVTLPHGLGIKPQARQRDYRQHQLVRHPAQAEANFAMTGAQMPAKKALGSYLNI
jgi:hypothetical protein